ncbi:hypothetical protein FOL47_007322 [Perkinsus chesapeaki]|uniref:Uncharacterized protein n=1 Tax=Perkinsus chesapeaki TaxID=330153 RepID=A0A7J6MXV7_PERCH|nr:hypothetical protein FOL47_007322 [Perkinsus chesapeaki]
MNPHVNGIVGELTLGAPIPRLPRPLVDMTPTQSCPKLGRAVPAIGIAAIRLKKPSGANHSPTSIIYSGDQPNLAYLDTGARSVIVQDGSLFDELIRSTRTNLATKGYPPEKIDKLLREVGGKWYISSAVLTSLPTLVVIVSSNRGKVEVNVEPEMYTFCTKHVYCQIAITVRRGTLAHASTLGVPFFRGYSMYVDYGSGKLSILPNLDEDLNMMCRAAALLKRVSSSAEMRYDAEAER